MKYHRITTYTVLGVPVTIPKDARSLMVVNSGLSPTTWGAAQIPPGVLTLPEQVGRLYEEQSFTSTAGNPVLIIVFY